MFVWRCSVKHTHTWAYIFFSFLSRWKHSHHQEAHSQEKFHWPQEYRNSGLFFFFFECRITWPMMPLQMQLQTIANSLYSHNMRWSVIQWFFFCLYYTLSSSSLQKFNSAIRTGRMCVAYISLLDLSSKTQAHSHSLIDGTHTNSQRHTRTSLLHPSTHHSTESMTITTRRFSFNVLTHQCRPLLRQLLHLCFDGVYSSVVCLGSD